MAIGGYNNITDEFFMLGGILQKTRQHHDIGYKYSYKTGIWTGIAFDALDGPTLQDFTQHNNVIYYWARNSIKTYNMTYPYSQEFSIPITGIRVFEDPCLSSDIDGNLFLSSSGFAILGHKLNYYGYNMNTNIWQTFRHSSYWSHYNYDMLMMACIVHNQILYTFGGRAGTSRHMSEYYGSNMISYHDVSDYNKPFLLNGYSLWKKSSQELKPPGGYFSVISVGELIYIIGGFSYNHKPDGTCCIGYLDDVQIFDPRTHTIKAKIDGVAPLPRLWSGTACHYRSVTHNINCFGGRTYSDTDPTKSQSLNKWIYSNDLLTKSPSNYPSNIPSISPTNVPTFNPTNFPTNIPTNIPSEMPSNTPSIFPTNIPSDTPTNMPSKSPSNEPSISPTNIPSYNPTYSPLKTTLSPTIAPSLSHAKVNIQSENTIKHGLPLKAELTLIFGLLIFFIIIIIGFVCVVKYAMKGIHKKNIKEFNSVNTTETQPITLYDGIKSTNITTNDIIQDTN